MRVDNRAMVSAQKASKVFLPTIKWYGLIWPTEEMACARRIQGREDRVLQLPMLLGKLPLLHTPLT